LDRRKCGDEIHATFADAHSFITETRYFGNKAHETALALILASRQEFYKGFAEGKFADGHLCKRIDRDAQRLKVKADGRLYATRLKMAEQPRKSTKVDTRSNAERLRKQLGRDIT